MDGLDELTQAVQQGQQPAYYRPPQRPRSEPRPNAFLTGMLMMLGAAPILFVVLILAFLVCEGILKAQVNSAIDDVRERVQSPPPPAPRTESESMFNK